MRTLLAVLLAAAAFTSACSSSGNQADGRSAAPSTAAAPKVKTLPLGKADLALKPDATYASPDGFTPALRITIPGDGWNSTHRGADAFDIGQPVPGVDAALLVVAFLTPQEASAEEALATIEQRAKDAGAKIEKSPSGLKVNGGSGPLVTSRDASIALDAVPDGYATIRADDSDGTLLTVTWVPDAKNRKLADERSAELTAAVSPA